LCGDALTDFNVMTRRGRFGHQVERLDRLLGVRRRVATGCVILFCIEGPVEVDVDGRQVMLGRHDALIVNPALVVLAGSGRLLWVDVIPSAV
jgi:hypothetical protein